MEFTFFTERGRQTLTYGQYLCDPYLRECIADQTRLRLNLGLSILSYDRTWLDAHPHEGASVLALEQEYLANPLQFFMPSHLDGGGALGFLNDDQNSIRALYAGNQRGKTQTGIVDILLDAIPCRPEWAIFAQHGVKYRPWTGPKQIGMATSEWTVMDRVLWRRLRDTIPKEQLGDYDPRLKQAREIAWRVNPKISLMCGTEIYFYVYEQKQGPFEGQVLHRFYWDEQGELSKFNGIDERLRTVRGRHTFGLTPHKVEGRPDTGARSWLSKMMASKQSKGHTIARYLIKPGDVPDWVYPETEKAKAYQKHIVEPEALQNLKAIREGRSRYFGEEEDASGLVYDEWDDKYHLVEPFPIPDSWTRYRGLDHGTVNPTTCLWAAVSPDGYIYLYREYYRRGETIYDNVASIVTASGNRLKPLGTSQGKVKGIFYERHLEEYLGERYHHTVLDGRSAATGDAISGLTLGTLYSWAGLRVTPASGKTTTVGIAAVKELLKIDAKVPHPRNGIMGAPRLMAFGNLKEFLRELRGYAMQEFRSERAAAGANQKEKPVGKDDHLMDPLSYLSQIPMRYVEGRWAMYERDPQKPRPTEEEEEAYDQQKLRKFSSRDPITGY